MGNTNERQRDESGELSITEGEVLNTDEESNLEKKVDELQMVVSRRNKQIKELKVKLGKREREIWIGLKRILLMKSAKVKNMKGVVTSQNVE